MLDWKSYENAIEEGYRQTMEILEHSRDRLLPRCRDPAGEREIARVADHVLADGGDADDGDAVALALVDEPAEDAPTPGGIGDAPHGASDSDSETHAVQDSVPAQDAAPAEARSSSGNADAARCRAARGRR